MRILFLDIDGVCNCAATKQRFNGFIGIDPVMAGRVKRIVAEAKCKVVLSSTWRLDALSRRHVKQNVCDFMDVTPNYPHAWRGEEVRTWLIDNAPQKDLQAYAILDDNADFGPDQPLFQTSFAVGLTDEIADKVIKHLTA